MAARFSISIRRRVLKQLAAIPKQMRGRIEVSIDQLATDVYPQGCKKLVGENGLWRIRVGDYRVIYLVDETVRVVDIRAVGHRREIYR